MTIKDIAKLTGFSVGTVSRALNNRRDVSAETKKAILEVVAAYKFEPNDNAKHLKMRSKSDIAIFVKGSNNMLFSDILEKLQSYLQAANESVHVIYLDEDGNEVEQALKLYRVRRLKGMIFLGADLNNFKEAFRAISIPCVLLTNFAPHLPYKNLSSVALDDYAAAQAVADFLVASGHRHLAVLGGNLETEQISYKRLQGFREAVEKYKLPFVLERQYQPCRYSLTEAYEATQVLLNKNKELSALFALGDVIALGALRAISDAGLQVPEDISLVGFDDILMSQFSVPRLATVRQDTATLAKRGVDILLRQLKAYPATEPVHELIAYSLCRRESVQQLNKENN